MHRQGAAVPSRGSGSFHIMQSYAGAHRAAREKSGPACRCGQGLLASRMGDGAPALSPARLLCCAAAYDSGLARRAAPWLCRFLKKCAGKEQGKGAPVRAGGGRFPFP